MQSDNKPIKDWKKILIDTSIICALFRAQYTTSDDTTLFINKLINYLSNSKSGDKSERTFLISTITLTELLTKEQDEEKIKRIVKVLHSNNVQFISFDTNTALEFNHSMAPYLHKTQLHKKAAEVGFVTGDYMLAREWISKDYMIALSGVVKNADVILTADKNTFYPVCQDVNGANCVLTYPSLFSYSEQYFFDYDYGNVDNFLKNIPFKTFNEIEESKPKAGVQNELFSNEENTGNGIRIETDPEEGF